MYLLSVQVGGAVECSAGFGEAENAGGLEAGIAGTDGLHQLLIKLPSSPHSPLNSAGIHSPATERAPVEPLKTWPHTLEGRHGEGSSHSGLS